MSDTPDYGQLIAVLFSSFPLSPSVAMTLYETSFELQRTGESESKVAGDMLSGTVRNLKKHSALGHIAGPAFEADVETEHGKGTVRFLLTHHGLEWRGLVQVPKHLRN